MRILAIETSCDETAVCLIEATGDTTDFSYTLLGNALYSQVEKHREYGGVFPSLAKREHARNLVPLLEKTLSEAQLLHPSDGPSITKEALGQLRSILEEREPELLAHLMLFLAQFKHPPIDAIAVTHGPGLEPALWVGVNFAKALSIAWSVPIVPVNHMEGHIIISAVQGTGGISTVKLPALAFLISGGHTELVQMPEWFTYKKIGATRDDAIGEAFDKTARLLGLPYPGGPEISKMAAEARAQNITPPFTLTRPMARSGDLDFSFSGMKTAVRNEVQKLNELSEDQRKGIAREIEDAITDVCEMKVRDALTGGGIQTLIIGGGVAANQYIKERLATLAAEFDTPLLISPPEHSTDNALMIALAGYFRATKKEYAVIDVLRAEGNLSL